MPPPKEAGVLLIVEDRMSIVKSNPEQAEKVQPAIELIVKQTMNINRLKGALVHLRSELDDTEDEPVETGAREEATMKKRVLIFFTKYNDFFAGIVDGYDGEKM
jgi:hypothetical protein